MSCYKCEYRDVGCHDDCPDYEKYVKKLEKIKKRKNKINLYSNYRCERKMK